MMNILNQKKHIKNIIKFHKRYIRGVTYKSAKNNFKIQLIGFDGNLKKEYKNINVKRILKDIEKMPMGHLEMKI